MLKMEQFYFYKMIIEKKKKKRAKTHFLMELEDAVRQFSHTMARVANA